MSDSRRLTDPNGGMGLCGHPALAAFVESGMRAGLHIGAQVSISVHGKRVDDFSIGLARPGHLLRPDHRILMMSAGKPIVATAIAQLWEASKLSPDDPVAMHIPEFASEGKDAITLTHLLTHTAAYQPPALDWPRLPWDEIITRICAARIPDGRTPGAYAAYDPQTGWYLLAEVIQRVTGERYYDFIQQTIWNPLECDRLSFGMTANEYDNALAVDDLALLHDTTATAREGALLADGTAPRWPADDTARAAARNPGGGAVGTAQELRLFYEMLLNGGRAFDNPDASPVIRPETIKALTSRVRVGMMDESFRHRVDWGLGFIINSARYGADSVPYGYGRHASEQAFGHGGMQSTVAFADPAHGLAVVAIFNGLPGEPKHNKRARDFCTLLYEQLGLARS